MARDGAREAEGAEGPAGRGAGQCEIRLLGEFTVLRHGAPVSDHQIGSRKARTLLKRLLVDRERIIGTSALAEVVWPEQPPDPPDRHVATLVSRLRATLGRQVVVRIGDGYRFGGGPAYRVDLAEAERLTAEAEDRLAAGESGLAHSAAGRALELLERGELLADEPEADWAAPARVVAEALLRRARRCGWAAALAVRELDVTVRVAEAALAADPFDEDACRALMRARHGQGELGRALAAYQRLRTALAEELGTDPAEPTRALHRAILRDEPDRPPAPPAGSAGLPPGSAVRPGPAALPRPGPEGFVGREPELAWLHRAWSAATGGTAGLALLVGEAGIGKTALAGELVRLAERTGGQVVRGRCYEAEQSLFLQPVADALRPVVVSASPELVRQAAGAGAGSLAELVPELAGVLGPLAYQRADREVERRRVFEAAAWFLRALAGRQPMLFFLDDLHLAGSSTVEFLHFLLRRLPGRRVLVLATVRPEEGGEVLDLLGDLADRWDLGPLSADAVAELARRSGVAEQAGPLLARTRGHSLYVVESLRALAERPAGVEAGEPAVPQSLRSVVVARMRRAGPGVDELLRAAATLGSGIDPEQVAALLDEPVEETVRRVAAAARARLVAEAGPRYEFANDLIREIAYQTTPLPVRIARHRRAAQLLADHPEAVAGHASRAGDWPAALAAFLRAAEQAAGRYANREAQVLLEQAMQAAVRAGEPVGMAQVRLARGRIREALADYPGAYEDHCAVVELAREHGRADLELAALNQLGGDLLVGLGRPSRECIPYLEAALAIAEETEDLPLQVDILGRLAVVWTNRLRFDLARGYADRALGLAGPDAGETVRALALDAAKTTLAYCGDLAGLAAVLPRLRRHLHRYQQGMHRYRQVQLQAWAGLEAGIPALAEGRWPEAADRIGQALETTRRGGYLAYEPHFLAHLAWLERAQGRYAEALRHGQRAVDLATGTAHPWFMAMAGAMHGWTLTELGVLDQAVVWLERGLAAAERDATEGYLVRCLGHLAWACVRRGEPERAGELAGRTAELLAGVTGGVFQYGGHAALAAAEAQLERGDPAAAQRLLAPIGRAAAESGWVETQAWADLLRARCQWALGDRDRAAGLAGTALATADRVGLAGIAWQAHAVLAGLAGGAGGTDAGGAGAARRHLVAGRAILDRLAGDLVDPPTRDAYQASSRARWHALATASAPGG